jgi:hypothetical protein
VAIGLGLVLAAFIQRTGDASITETPSVVVPDACPAGRRVHRTAAGALATRASGAASFDADDSRPLRLRGRRRRTCQEPAIRGLLRS